MRRAGAVALLALALAGCSGTPSDPASEPSRETTPGASSEAPTAPGATPSGGVDPNMAAREKALAKLAASAQALAGHVAAQAIPPHDGPVLGADVSWPQCPAGMGIPHKISTGAPMPLDDAAYVVIGLTNGPGFHANPCLADQVAWARSRGLLVAAYSVISWPDDATLKEYRGPRAAGYAQAQFNLASMQAAGLDSPIIWLDIEHVPFYDWTDDLSANAEVVLGAAQGYMDAGYRVGVYSTPHLWASVVGDLSLGLPEWRAAGKTSQEEALSRCGSDWMIQGGVPALAQWVEDGRDRDVTCPGVETELGEYFRTLGG